MRKIKKFFKSLGPGFITGAADDDPSGIATYSIAGAQFGYRLNWLTLFLLPMMISIQEMCGRIGMMSGKGLAGVIKKYYSSKHLYTAVFLMTTATIINIAADLGMMAASLQMVIGLSHYYWLFIVTLVTVGLEIFIPYKKYSVYLRYLSMTLLVYVVTAFFTKQNWQDVITYTFIPHIEFSTLYFMTMVGFIGTTISPFLFFWQASEEVEEEIEHKQIADFNKKPHINIRSLRKMAHDTKFGMIFSNVITFCIVLTSAATLHKAGITDLETPQQVALALKPIAGNFAFLLFTLGIIGIGLQSIPVLAGSIAYAVSEALSRPEGLGKNMPQAKLFYAVIAAATVLGALLNLTGINPVQALYYSAIINGVLSVPLIAIVIRLSSNPDVVGQRVNSKMQNIFGWATFTFIGIASILMIYNMII